MRNTRICLLLVVSGLVIALGALKDSLALTTKTKPSPIPRIAVCNVARVFEDYLRVNDLNTEVGTKDQEVKAEIEKRENGVKTLEEEVKLLTPGSDEHEKRFLELFGKKGEFEGWKTAKQGLLLQWHYRLTKQMLEEIYKTVEEVAKEQGYHLVLFQELSELEAANSTELYQVFIRRKVLYSDDSLDITEAVLARLNRNYRPSSP